MGEEDSNRIEEVHEGESGGRSEVAQAVMTIYLLLLAGALIAASMFFTMFTTEAWSPNVGHRGDVTLSPTETYVHNVTISYEIHELGRGYGTRLENGSIVVEEPPLANTLTRWERGWITFSLEVNATVLLNKTLSGPEGVIGEWGIMSIAPGGVSWGIEITQGGTFRLFLQNLGSERINLTLNWELDWHIYEKPRFYYGIAGLAIGAVGVVVGLFFPARALWKWVRDTGSSGHEI